MTEFAQTLAQAIGAGLAAWVSLLMLVRSSHSLALLVFAVLALCSGLLSATLMVSLANEALDAMSLFPGRWH